MQSFPHAFMGVKNLDTRMGLAIVGDINLARHDEVELEQFQAIFMCKVAVPTYCNEM